MSTVITTTVEPLTVVAPAEAPPLRGSRRPARALMLYYLLRALATGPGLIVVLPYSWFRFRTLRYDFDEQGITVRVGILFRREVTLTYARIQDLHLVSNVVERWLGLGRIQIQTASGQSAAEATIEGLHDFEDVRDELYRRMRGARGVTARRQGSAAADHDGDAIASALRETAAELRALRARLEQGGR